MMRDFLMFLALAACGVVSIIQFLVCEQEISRQKVTIRRLRAELKKRGGKR
jgi:hypothetical protein